MKRLLILCAVLLCIVSCKNINSENVKVVNIKNSSMKGYIYQIENNTDKNIYYYGLEYNLPWVFIDINKKGKWANYGKCHYSDKLHIYNIAPRATLNCMLPWIDYKKTHSFPGPRNVRIKFPYAFSKEEIQPISADIKEYLWNYSYGKFNMPPVPTSTIEKD